MQKLKGSEEGYVMTIVDGQFADYRWEDGRWNFDAFKDAKGNVVWDAVIDAEIARRQLLEETPVASISESVRFDTSEIPWWAWVKRFHLPEVHRC